MVNREKAQSLMNYDYPREQNHYNNPVGRYNVKFNVIQPSVLTHAMVESVPFAYNQDDLILREKKKPHDYQEHQCLKSMRKLAKMLIGDTDSSVL